MSTYDTLVARGNQRGTATRPSRSDNYWPPEGTKVPWVLAQPNQNNLAQKGQLGWRNLGTVGNVDHLRKHGDHTPWSVISGNAKRRGIIYADDTEVSSWVEDHLVAICRIDDYDTTWIHFFNVNGSQYNYAGQRVASSGDQDLHISTREGYEFKYHTLLLDVDRHRRGLPLLRGKKETNVTTVNVDPNQNFELPPWTWLRTHPSFKDRESVQNGLHLVTMLLETWGWLEEMSLRTLPRIEEKIDNQAQPEIDYPRLAKAIVDEFYARNVPPS